MQWYHLTHYEFFTPALADGLSLESDVSKSPQISRSLLSILADFNETAVWMVSTCPLIFNSSSPLSKLLRTVPSTPTKIGITVTLSFRIFFSTPARSKYMSSFFSFSLIFTQLSFIFLCDRPERTKSTRQQILFSFLLINFWSGFLPLSDDPFISIIIIIIASFSHQC